MNSAFRKALLSSYDFYQARRWEGESLAFKIKYLIANYPEMALGTVVFGVIAPIIAAYKYFTFEGSIRAALRKYRPRYIVIRDDDPNVQQIIDEKEAGRHFFPQ